MWHTLNNDGLVLARFTSETDAMNNTPNEGSLIYSADRFDYLEAGTPKAIPAPPSSHHDWDWPTKSWLPNLDVARESQRQAWNAWRDHELIVGYAHNGHIFHSDDRFMAELQFILKGYERGHLTGTFAIRTRGNAVLQMSHTEIEGLLLLIGLHRQAIYAQSWAGKDALAALATLEDIMVGGPPTLEQP